MSSKTKRIIAIVVAAIPSIMIIMSAVSKLAGVQTMIDHYNSIGIGSYVKLFGVCMLIMVALFWIPKTQKLGLLFLTGYLGGAMAAELSHGGQPGMIAGI